MNAYSIDTINNSDNGTEQAREHYAYQVTLTVPAPSLPLERAAENGVLKAECVRDLVKFAERRATVRRVRVTEAAEPVPSFPPSVVEQIEQLREAADRAKPRSPKASGSALSD